MYGKGRTPVYDRGVSSGYPAHREADVVLHDGSTVRLRPVRAGDQGLLRALFERLGEESRAFRFFSGAVDLERAAVVLADVDYADRYGLIATRGGEDRVVGHGLYVGDGGDRAEVAFAVDEELQGRGLREFAAPQAGLGNPVDLIAAARAEDFRRAIVTLSAWEGVDAIISIFIRPLATSSEEVAAAIGQAVGEVARPLPVQAVFMTSGERAPLARASRVPTHAQPEGAARALGKALAYAEWRRRPPVEAPELAGIRGDEAAAAIAEALAEGREWLSAEECERVLRCYGVETPESRLVESIEAAGAAAAGLGGRVALKAHGAGIIHKSELGAVAVGLEGSDEVRAAAERMRESLVGQGLEPEAFLIQQMVEGGTELLVGMATDPLFGPVLACGAGGTAVELLGDVALRVCPITRADAAQMIRSLATFPLLTGFRGAPTADLDALEDLLLRVSTLAAAHDEIVELDLNPVLATPKAAIAADARIRIASPPPHRSWPRTWA
jgi:acetate---CoA ligase (ADP-forming)